MLSWEFTRDPATSDADVVSNGVLTHGRSLAVAGNAHPLACFVREQGAVVAGALGRVEYQRLFINSLWVVESRRGLGLGSAVLERLEQEATALGCKSAMIETLNDRVAKLYTRKGYRSIATVVEYVGPFNRHILLKSLSNVSAGSAA
jgi:GNAT superfamily N-acetyltransferase